MDDALHARRLNAHPDNVTRQQRAELQKQLQTAIASEAFAVCHSLCLFTSSSVAGLAPASAGLRVANALSAAVWLGALIVRWAELRECRLQHDNWCARFVQEAVKLQQQLDELPPADDDTEGNSAWRPEHTSSVVTRGIKVDAMRCVRPLLRLLASMHL